MRVFVASLLCATAVASVARAQDVAPAQEAAAPTAALAGQIAHLESLITDQAAQLARQEKEIADQRSALKAQQGLLDNLKLSQAAMASTRAAGSPIEPVAAAATASPDGPAPFAVATGDNGNPAGQAAPVVSGEPVGQAPPPADNRIIVASLPEASTVLTPKGHWVAEPSLTFTHGSSNRLVFRGAEIALNTILVGAIEASDADQNLTSASIDYRYGLTNRIELETRIPFVYRTDRVTLLSQGPSTSTGVSTSTQTETINGSDLGDVEFAVRYQINNGNNGLPVLIAGLRAKSDTGSDPYSILRDSQGVSEKAATGSGFWGLEPSLSLLYPSDPAVIFANIGYFEQLPRTIGRTIGGSLIGRVSPGGSIDASAGFGFALNPRFSFSLGYRDTYIFPTSTVQDGTVQKSTSLQVGAFTFGWSFQLTPRITLSNTYDIGTTRDAPDMSVAFRLPIRF
jgi:hypothetical protein